MWLSCTLCLLAAQDTLPLLTLNIDDLPLLDVVEELEQPSSIRCFFRSEWVEGVRVSVSAESSSVTALLNQILSSTDLGYVRYGERAFVIMPRRLLGIEFEQAFYEARYQEVLNEVDDANTQQFIMVGDTLNPSPSGRAVIEGTLSDEQTGEPLIAAVMYVKETDQSAITDAAGKFVLELPIGQQQLSAQSIGYVERQYDLKVVGDGPLSIKLSSQAYQLQAIIVEEEGVDRNISSAQIGVASLSIKEIKQLPSFLGEADILKSLISLPGVSSVGDGASGINVRGGDVGQNLILMDGALLFNSSHVLGFFSAFNPDVVSKVNLYKGNIPAQYGGRLSSVLDVGLKDGDFEEFQVQGGIGLAASRAMIQGPIIKDCSAFVLSGRVSSINWMLNRIKNPDVRASVANFYDYNARFHQRIGQKSVLLLSYYQSFDRFRFSDDYVYNWDTRLGNAEWKQIYANTLSSTTTLGYGQLNNTYSEPEGVLAFQLDNGLSYLKGKHNFLYTALPGHTINAGLEVIDYRLKEETLAPGNDLSNIMEESIPKDQGREWAVYLNDEFSVGDRFSFSVGLRWSLFQDLGPGKQLVYTEGQPLTDTNVTDTLSFGAGEEFARYSGWEPRLSMRYRTGANSSVKLSYNRLYQYIHLLSNTMAATPADVWQTSTAYIPPQRADSYSLGFFQNFAANNWETSVEVYYKDIDPTVEYRDFAQLLQNSYLETELVQGEGRAYGLEMAIKRKQGRLSGWLSYTYARSLRRVVGEFPTDAINGGDWFPANIDQPHSVDLALTWQANKRNRLAVNFIYRTGRPTTVPLANFFYNNLPLPYFSERNAFRIPDYHRMDVSYTWEPRVIRTSKFQWDLNFSIYNFYLRRNVYSIFFRRQLGSSNQAFQLSILGSAFPAVTWNFKF